MAKKQQLFSISNIHLGILKSDPPKLSVTVSGLATTSGWENSELKPLEKKLSADGILDLDFIAEPPDGISLQVLSPITAHLIWEEDVERLVGVKVYSRTEDQVQLLQSIRGGELSPEMLENMLTTLAIGEEGNPPTTLLKGEEGDLPTTERVGEEAAPPTTLAFGEEGNPPTTWLRGEEGSPPTTLMFGEEGNPPTTWLQGEEGGGSTFRIGEEGPGPKPFFGETDPRVDDPGPIEIDPRFIPRGPRNPFGRR